jgi:hypothetical protein
MPIQSDNNNLDRAWSEFVASYPATFAVTLAYNPSLAGTVFPAYRLMDAGERIQMPMPALRARSGAWQLAALLTVPCERIHIDLDRLHRDIDRKLFGSRFHKLPPKRRTGFIGLIESPEAKVHVHLSWRVPEDRSEAFAGLIHGQWLRITPYGSTRIRRISDKGWGSYSTKERPSQKPPELFVASRT